MSETDVAQSLAASSQAPPTVDAETVAALGTIGALFDIAQVWEGALNTVVFSGKFIANAKAALSYRRRLATPEGLAFLAYLWQNGGTPTDAELEAAGLERTLDKNDPITCHGLAEELAESKFEVSREEKRIQKIVEAAEAYGLIARPPLKGPRIRPMRGTQKLHDLMLHVHREAKRICSEISSCGQGAEE